MAVTSKEIVYQYRVRDVLLSLFSMAALGPMMVLAGCAGVIALRLPVAPWWVEAPLIIVVLLTVILAGIFLQLWRRGLLYTNVRLRFADDVLEMHTAFARTCWAWQDVSGCDKTTAGLRLRAGVQSLLVPGHAFANSQEQREFVKAIQEAQASAKGRPTECLPTPEPSAVTYSLQLRRTDLFIFVLSRRWRSWLLWLPCAALGWGWAAWQDRGSPWPSEPLGLFVMAVPYMLKLALILGPLDALVRTLPIRRNNALLSPLQITFDGMGLHLSSASAHSLVPWANIREVKRTWGGGIRVMYPGGKGLPLPRRAFSSAQDRTALLQRLAAWRAAAKST